MKHNYTLLRQVFSAWGKRNLLKTSMAMEISEFCYAHIFQIFHKNSKKKKKK